MFIFPVMSEPVQVMCFATCFLSTTMVCNKNLTVDQLEAMFTETDEKM